jgi:hypothetical protein
MFLYICRNEYPKKYSFWHCVRFFWPPTSPQQPQIEHLNRANTNTEAHLPRHKRQRHDACGDAGATIARPAGASVVNTLEQTALPTPATAASDVDVVAIVVVAEDTAAPPLPPLPDEDEPKPSRRPLDASFGDDNNDDDDDDDDDDDNDDDDDDDDDNNNDNDDDDDDNEDDDNNDNDGLGGGGRSPLAQAPAPAWAHSNEDDDGLSGGGRPPMREHQRKRERQRQCYCERQRQHVQRCSAMVSVRSHWLFPPPLSLRCCWPPARLALSPRPN